MKCSKPSPNFLNLLKGVIVPRLPLLPEAYLCSPPGTYENKNNLCAELAMLVIINDDTRLRTFKWFPELRFLNFKLNIVSEIIVNPSSNQMGGSLIKNVILSWVVYTSTKSIDKQLITHMNWKLINCHIPFPNQNETGQILSMNSDCPENQYY